MAVDAAGIQEFLKGLIDEKVDTDLIEAQAKVKRGFPETAWCDSKELKQVEKAMAALEVHTLTNF